VTCERADADAVNEALLAGTPRRAVARRFGIAHSSVDRHWEHCVPDRLRRAMGETDSDVARVMDGRYLLETMAGLVRQAEEFSDDVWARWEAHEPGVRPGDVVRALSLYQSMLLSAFKLSETVRSRREPPPSAPGLPDQFWADLERFEAEAAARQAAAGPPTGPV